MLGVESGKHAALFEERWVMYKFDNAWRRRLLEDALVADLLDVEAGEQPSALAGGPKTATPVEAPAARSTSRKAA